MLLQPCKVCLNRSQMACFTHNLHIGLTQCVYTSCAPAMPNRQTCATNNKVYWYRHEMRECINFSEITVILTWRFYVGCIIPKCLGYYTFMLLPHEHTLCARLRVMFQRQKQNACICAQSDFACLASYRLGAIGRGQRAGELLRPGIPGSRTDLEYFKRMPKINWLQSYSLRSRRYSRARENGKLEIPPAQKRHILSSPRQLSAGAFW
jgi:hypothetical protein